MFLGLTIRQLGGYWSMGFGAEIADPLKFALLKR